MALTIKENEIGLSSRRINADPIGSDDTTTCLALRDINGLKYDTTKGKLSFLIQPTWFHAQLYHFSSDDYKYRIQSSTAIDSGVVTVSPIVITPMLYFTDEHYKSLDSEFYVTTEDYKNPLKVTIRIDFNTGGVHDMVGEPSSKVKPFRWAILPPTQTGTQPDSFLLSYVPVAYDSESHYNIVEGSSFLKIYFNDTTDEYSISSTSTKYTIGQTGSLTWNLL